MRYQEGVHFVQHRRRRRWVAVLIVLLVVGAGAAGGAALWQRSGANATATVREQPPAQVTVANVARRDVPIFVSGLGTVQASRSVTIRSQVDGTLQDVLFTEGQHVKKDDVLAKIDPRLFQAALDQAIARKAQDEAQLVAADKDLSRFKTLGARGYETQQNIDQQTAKVGQLKAAIQADAAAIETARTQLDYTSIVAPGDGRIGVRLVDPGNIVHATDQTPIATLVQTQPIAVMFTMPARLLDDVREAMKRGPVDVAAFDSDNRRQLATGTLLLIDNAIDQATATMRLKAMFPNEDDALWPGEFVNARVLLDVRRDALVVPTAAVQRGPQGLFVWVTTANGTVVMRPIEAGPTSGDLTVVASGVAEGDRVVTDGQLRLQQNARVAFAEPPSPDAGKTP